MSEEIKQCPFCGGIPQAMRIGSVLIKDDPANKPWFVRCLTCEASCRFCCTREDAIATWNRRFGDE